MGDQRVIVEEGGEVWCQNSKRRFNIRLLLNMRENKTEEDSWKGIEWFRVRDVSFYIFF